MIKFHCEHCGHKIAAQDDWTDRKVRCPTCGKATVVHTEENDGENTPVDGQVVEPSEYSVSKTILGKQNVSYRCTSCAAELSSHLEEAGQKRTCPTCSRDFIVPGRLEREQMIQEAQQHAAQKEAQRLREIEAAAAKLTKDQERQQKDRQQKRQPQQQSNASPQTAIPGQIALGADRFLRWSFLVAKYISVLIVAGCFLVVVCCFVMLAFAYPKIVPFTPPPTASLQNPSWAEYKQSLPAPSSQSPAPSGNDVQQSAAQPSPSTPDPLKVRVQKMANLYTLSDDCVKQIMVKLGLDYELGSSPTSITDDKTKEMFLSGLEGLLADVQKYAKTTGASPEATSEQAAEWYLHQFESNEEMVRQSEKDANDAQAQAEQRAELARLEASEERMRLLVTIGGAIAALLAFLFLPLLIQIEQNTRKQQTPQTI